MKQKNLFPNHISDKGLISKIQKELIFCSSNRKKHPIKEWAGDLHRHTDAQQVQKKLFSFSNHPKMKTKTTVTYHLTSVRMAIFKKQKNDKSWWGCGAQETLCTVGGNANWGFHYGKQYGGPQKLKRTTVSFHNSTSRYLSKENINTNSKRYIHTHVYSSVVYNSQDIETTLVPINGWLNNEDVIYIYVYVCVCIYTHTYTFIVTY